MAAKGTPRRGSVVASRYAAIAYLLGSLAAALLVRPPIFGIDGDAVGFVIGYCLFGPLSTLVHALYDHGDTLVGLAFYAVQTALLAGSLLLWTLRFWPARWFGYFAAAVIWVGSGYMMALVWAFRA